MNKYYYGTESSGEPDYDFLCVWDQDDNLDYIAEAAAEDYHRNHDGWEDDWPVTLTIFDEDKKVIGDFEIDREHEPTFSARKL